MKRICNVVKKSITFYIVVYVLLLFLSRKIINNYGYEYMSWIYYLSALGIIIIIIIFTIKNIIKKEYNFFEKVIYSFLVSISEVLIYIIFISFIFALLDIKSDSIIFIGKTKYVRSHDIFKMAPTPTYYEYYNFIIRKNKRLEITLDFE